MKNSHYYLKTVAVFIFLLSGVGSSIVAQSPSESQPLPPDQIVERALAAEETHRYAIRLEANEFFQVRAEQKGVDVMLTLVDGNNKTAAVFFTPNGKEGFETLSYAAKTAGDFVLEVSAFGKDAERGNYTLRRENPRAATASDLRRVAVEALFVDAIVEQFVKKQTDAAIKKFEEALAGWRELKDDYLAQITERQIVSIKKSQAEMVFNEAYDFLGRGTAEASKTALEKFREAARLYLEIGDKSENYGLALNGAGIVFHRFNDYANALKFYEQASDFFRANNYQKWQAVMLNNLGRVYDESGDSRKALDFYNQALTIYKAIGDKNFEASTLANIGLTLTNLGENQKALDYFNQALILHRQFGNKPGEGKTLSSLGRAYADSGDRQKALDFYNQAIAVQRQTNDISGEATTVTNIGGVYLDLGDVQKALDYFNQALPLRRKSGDRNGEASTLTSIGSAYADLNDDQKALDFYNQAITIYRQIGYQKGESIVLNNLSLIYDKTGDKGKALDYQQQALKIARQLGDKSGESASLGNIGKFYVDLGERQKALDYFNQSLILARQLGDKNAEALLLNNMSAVWVLMNNKPVAVFYGKQSVNKYQELRRNIKDLDREIQKTYLEKIGSIYRGLADLLISQGRFAPAEKVLAMLKNEEYFDFVRRDAGEIGKLDERIALDEKEKTLITRYSALADRITAASGEFVKLDDKKRLLSRTDQTLAAEDQKRYDELAAEIETANAAFQLFLTKELVAEIGTEKTKEIEVDRNLQDKLRKWGAGTVALYTVAGADRYRVILTTAKTQVDGKTEIKIADLNKKVFAFRAALQNPNVDPRPLGKELYDILIKPIESELKAANAKTLVWSLDGTLRYIPLAALSPDGKRYLVEDVQNVIITPKTRDDLTDSDAAWQAVGLGVSDALTVESPEDKTVKIPFNPLPGTEKELASIVKDEKTPTETGVLVGRRYLNKDFTIANFKDALAKENENGKRRYNVVHIASHFRLGNNDSNSFILLGGGQILTLEEIRNSAAIDFNDVELVTLSACNTAFADAGDGKEIDSLASVIQTKSGKSVLATLWAVADTSTSELMSEFYRVRKENPKLSKAEAMQTAQQTMLRGAYQTDAEMNASRSVAVKLNGEKTNQPEYKKDDKAPFAHPFYWSPFILFGNWK